MNRYWRGTTNNGCFVTEAQGTAWNEVAADLVGLEFVLEDKNVVIKLPKNARYVQAKTCGADLATGKCAIESRYLGCKLENNTIQIRVMEDTNEIFLEILDNAEQ